MRRLILTLACLAFTAACAMFDAGAARPLAALGTEPFPGGSGRAGLPVVLLKIGAAELAAEVARTPLQKASGLTYRNSLPPDNGMLFVNSVPQLVAYSNRDTPVALSCAYLDPEGVIMEIHDMAPGDTTVHISRSERVQYVLEARQGWFRDHGIIPGGRVLYLP